MAEALKSGMIETWRPSQKLLSDLLSAIQRWPEFRA